MFPTSFILSYYLTAAMAGWQDAAEKTAGCVKFPNLFLCKTAN